MLLADILKRNPQLSFFSNKKAYINFPKFLQILKNVSNIHIWLVEPNYC